MANLNAKYHTHIYPDLGITLKRFYCGASPDELGRVDFWKQSIDEMYAKMPCPDLWKNLTIEIWHMDHPDLLEAGKVTLADYDPNTPGCQVAAGLYFGNERLALGVFPEGWQAPQPNNPRQVNDYNAWKTRNVLPHEIGHWYFDQSGMNKGGTSHIQKILDWNWENVIRIKQIPNTHEEAAEFYRAMFGTSDTIGRFSDNKPFVPGEKKKSFVKMIYMLYGTLKNTYIRSFQLHDTWCEWEEGYWWWEQKKRALTSNWDLFEWRDNGWRQL